VKKNYFIQSFIFFQVFMYDFIITLQIGSRIEYLIPTENIMVLLLHLNLRGKYITSSTGFQYDLMKIRKWFTFWATLHIFISSQCVSVHQ